MGERGWPIWHCRILGRPRGSVNKTRLSDIRDNWRIFDLSARNAGAISGCAAVPQNGGP